MKKGWKIFWIICGVMLSAGIVFAIAGGILGAEAGAVKAELAKGITIGGEDGVHFLHWSILDDDDWDDDDHWDDDGDSDLDDEEWEGGDMDYEYGQREANPDSRDDYQGIEELKVDVAGVLLQILPSEDEDVHVETKEIDSRLKYSCKQSGGTLKIQTTTRIHLINRINSHATVWVYLPARELKEIDISNGAGAIYAESVNAREFSIETGAGECVVKDFKTRELELECGAGAITAAGDAGKKADISCGVGEVNLTLAGREEEYRCDVECGIGEVTVGEHEISGLGREYDGSGDKGDRELSVECGMGCVDVSFAR